MDKKYKVFGIGLNKTGTTSLKQAFRKLGYDHADVRGQMTHKFFRGNIEQVLDASEAFESFEDWPWPLMYQQVFARYGDKARYILTRRKSAEDWVESLKSHSLDTSPSNNPRLKVFGHPYPHGFEAEHIAYYENHLTEVKAFFALKNATHLLLELCFEEGDGWPELAPFLDEEIPITAFPHANRRAVQARDVERRRENQARIDVQLRLLKP